MLRQYCMRLPGAILLVLIMSGASFAAPDVNRMQANTVKVDDWNTFAEKLLQLHMTRIQQHEVRTEKRSGGYSGMEDFYQEISYYDDKSGKLLSRIQTVTDRPELVHSIEVYIYDAQSRLMRDYLAYYLPGGRNAPVQTLINLHGYNQDVHAFRSFDASGELILEQCLSNDAQQNVLLMLDFDELYAARREGSKILQGALYKKCFADLPQELRPEHYPQSLLQTK